MHTFVCVYVDPLWGNKWIGGWRSAPRIYFLPLNICAISSVRQTDDLIQKQNSKESRFFFTALLLTNREFIRACVVSPTEKYELCELPEIIFHQEISHSPCFVVFVWIVSLLALFKLWLGWFWPNQVTCILRCTSYSCHVLWLLWKRLWHCVCNYPETLITSLI